MNIVSRRFDVRYDVDDNPVEVAFTCPGCAQYHAMRTEHAPGDDGPSWTMEGTAERPTLSPSIRFQWTEYDDGDDGKPLNPVDHTCHFHVENGTIKFCMDCTHHLAGQHVEPVMMHRPVEG